MAIERFDSVFVVNAMESLQPAHDTSVALMEAAQARGHRVLVTDAVSLSYRDGRPRARCLPVKLTPAEVHDHQWVADPAWFVSGEPVDYDLSDAHVLYMRTDPPVDDAYLRATYLLDFVDPDRTLVVNRPDGLRNVNEHTFSVLFDDLIAPTLVTAEPDLIGETVRTWGRAVLKPIEGMAGRGVMLLDPADPNLASILETATGRGQRQVVVQRWIDEVDDGDRRIIVLAGEPIGAVRRMGLGSGEFRCNMSTGAVPVRDEVGGHDRRICARLAPLFAVNGLHLAGIDVIGGLLTEVNVTSPTGIREIDALSGTDLAGDVVAWTRGRMPASPVTWARPAAAPRWSLSRTVTTFVARQESSPACAGGRMRR